GVRLLRGASGPAAALGLVPAGAAGRAAAGGDHRGQPAAAGGTAAGDAATDRVAAVHAGEPAVADPGDRDQLVVDESGVRRGAPGRESAPGGGGGGRAADSQLIHWLAGWSSQSGALYS